MGGGGRLLSRAGPAVQVPTHQVLVTVVPGRFERPEEAARQDAVCRSQPEGLRRDGTAVRALGERGQAPVEQVEVFRGTRRMRVGQRAPDGFDERVAQRIRMVTSAERTPST